MHWLCVNLLAVIWLSTVGASTGFAAVSTSRSKLGEATSDLDLKLEEARRLHLTNSTRSRQLAEEALATARQRGDRLNEAAALVEVAVALRRQNLNGRAVQHIRQALTYVDKLESAPLRQRALKEAGHTFWAFGDLPGATDYFQRALKLSEEIGDLGARADAEAGLGSVAAELNDRPRARAHQERALALAEQSGDEIRVGHYARNLGNTCFDEKDFPGARRLFTRSLELFQKHRQRTSVADSRADLARVDEAEGKLEAAESTLRSLLPSRRRLRGHVKITATLVQLASVLRQRGKHDEALKFLAEAREHASHLASASKILVLDALADTHEARGDLAAAIQALRERQKEIEVQYGEAAQTRAAEVRETFAAERREAEIAQLRATEQSRADALRATEAELRANLAELERARWQQYGLAGVLLLGAITAGTLISRQRLKAATDRRILEEARAAQRAAEEADRVKTRFLGIASHDIHGPLGNIVTLSDELRAEKSISAPQIELCEVISSEAQRVINLVEDLITTAALESGKLRLRPAPLDLSHTIKSVIASLRTQTEAKRQTVHFVAPPEPEGALVGDAARLHQVLYNLVSNAIKFSPQGETITVTLARQAATVVLTVRDCGPGISAEEIPRLFAPFERLSTHPTAGESSHGLGLSIAHEIVRLHRGTIRVESTLGQGATFIVELPA